MRLDSMFLTVSEAVLSKPTERLESGEYDHAISTWWRAVTMALM